MNSLSLLFVCGSLALLFSAHYAEGFMCYKCTGATDVCSEDNSKTGTKTTCGTNIKSCMKAVTTDANDAVTVVRDCAPATVSENDCTETTPGGTKVETCVCIEDSCNGSTGLHVSFTFLVVAMVAVAIFNRL